MKIFGGKLIKELLSRDVKNNILMKRNLSYQV